MTRSIFAPAIAPPRSTRFLRRFSTPASAKPKFAISRTVPGCPPGTAPPPAFLASRLPYGTEVTPQRLGLVEGGEAALRALGFRQFRVRLHDKLARIEISPEEMPRALAPEMAAAMADRLKAEGFTYVALDLEGYRQGSLNETLSPAGQRSAKAARGT